MLLRLQFSDSTKTRIPSCEEAMRIGDSSNVWARKRKVRNGSKVGWERKVWSFWPVTRKTRLSCVFDHKTQSEKIQNLSWLILHHWAANRPSERKFWRFSQKGAVSLDFFRQKGLGRQNRLQGWANGYSWAQGKCQLIWEQNLFFRLYFLITSV